MKNIKSLLIMIFTFTFLFIGIKGVKADTYDVVSAMPGTIGPVSQGACIAFTESVSLVTGDTTDSCSSSGVGFTHYKHAGNVPTACVDYDKTTPAGTSVVCTLDTSLTEAQQIALAKLIIDKGMRVTSSPDYTNYFWTQVIGQYYMRGASLGNHDAYSLGGESYGAYHNSVIVSTTNTEIAAMNAEVARVNNASNVSLTEGTIDGWTYNNEYWVSKEFTYSGGTPTVTASPSISGITVTNTATSGKVAVKIPASSVTPGTTYTITLTINGTKITYYKTSVYNCTGHQDILTPYMTKHEKGGSASRTGTFTAVGFSKQDIANSKELKGATLEILDSNKNHITLTETLKKCSSLGFLDGSEYMEWISGTTPNILNASCLPNGKYYLRETLPADGYKVTKKGNDIEFTISGGKPSTGTVVMNNELTVVQISKKDATTKKELAGATLSILDYNKKQIDLTKDKYKNVKAVGFEFIEGKGISWLSTGEKMEIQGLPLGTYYLVEEASPKGYDKTTEEIKIEITMDKVVTEGEITNTLTVTVPNTGIDSKVFIIIGLNLVVIGSIVVYFTMRKRKKA